MSPFEIARARQNTYFLFGQLLLRGVHPTTIDQLRRLPPLAQHLPDEIDIDQLAAQHQELFGFNLFPYEASFLGEDGQLGGPITEAVMSSYQGINFQQPTEDSSPDHIGVELMALSFLCAAEGDAWGDSKPLIAKQIQQREKGFVSTHIGRWLPALTVAVEGFDIPLYRAGLDLLLGFLEDHLVDLGQARPQPKRILPLPPSLADDKTDLKQIARYILLPVHSGLFISRHSIQTLGRQLDIPRGFGNREQLLLNLFKSAAYLDEIPSLMQALKTWIEAWEMRYEALSAKFPTVVALEPSWPQKVSQTKAFLQEMQAGFEKLVRDE